MNQTSATVSTGKQEESLSVPSWSLAREGSLQLTKLKILWQDFQPYNNMLRWKNPLDKYIQQVLVGTCTGLLQALFFLQVYPNDSAVGWVMGSLWATALVLGSIKATRAYLIPRNLYRNLVAWNNNLTARAIQLEAEQEKLPVHTRSADR